MKIRCLAGLALVASLAACGGVRPPVPPGPPPGPATCPAGTHGTPPACEPDTPPPPPDGALPTVQVVAGRFVPALFGFAHCCCCDPPADPAHQWPSVPPEQADSYATCKRTDGKPTNLSIVRTGLFSDQGYGWNLLPRAREDVVHANAKGIYAKVDMVDAWALVHVDPNFYGDGCEVTQGAPPLRYQRHVREVVRTFGDLGVFWDLGNEGWRCHPSRAWEDGLIAVIRQAETDFGFPHHLIGSTYNVGQVNPAGQGRVLYDFVSVHGWALQPAVTNAAGQRVPVIFDETDNVVHSPQEWVDLVAAYEAGGDAVAIWRGPDTNEVWHDTLARYGGQGPPPYTPVNPTFPIFPSGTGTWTWASDPAIAVGALSWQRRPSAYERLHGPHPNRSKTLVPAFPETAQLLAPASQTQPELLAVFQAAMDRVKAKHPELFRADGCLAVTGVHRDGDDRFVFADAFSRLQGEFPTRFTFVGDEAKPWGVRDEIEIARTEGTADPNGEYEGYHPWASNGCPLSAQAAVCPAGQRCRIFRLSGGAVYPLGPAAPPAPPDGPPAPPPPAPAACAFTSAAVTSWPLEVKAHGGQSIDSTAVACGPVPPCGNPNPQLAPCCFLSEEKANAPCADALFGEATWSIVPGSGDVKIVWPLDTGQGPNRYSVKVAEGTGVLQLTGSKDPRACIRVHVTATVPPCVVDGNGKCKTEACP